MDWELLEMASDWYRKKVDWCVALPIISASLGAFQQSRPQWCHQPKAQFAFQSGFEDTSGNNLIMTSLIEILEGKEKLNGWDGPVPNLFLQI